VVVACKSTPRGGVPAIGRWKMLDNLRRSLSAPVIVLALIPGWAAPALVAPVWTAFVLSTMATQPQTCCRRTTSSRPSDGWRRDPGRGERRSRSSRRNARYDGQSLSPRGVGRQPLTAHKAKSLRLIALGARRLAVTALDTGKRTELRSQNSAKFKLRHCPALQCPDASVVLGQWPIGRTAVIFSYAIKISTDAHLQGR
jgi:hypothetical protein